MTSTTPSRRRHPSYAAVTSTLALVVAVGGSGVAVAAATLPRNSVGSAQIRNGQVRGDDLAAKAVTGAKVRDDSLTGADIRESTLALPAAPRVFAGPVNPSGIVLTDAAQTVASVTFTAPSAGYVTILAQSRFNAGEDGTWLEADVVDNGTTVGGDYWDAGDSDGFYDQTQTLTVTRPVSKGTHTVELTLYERSVAATYSRAYLASVTAQFFPSGAAGEVELPD